MRHLTLLVLVVACSEYGVSAKGDDEQDVPPAVDSGDTDDAGVDTSVEPTPVPDLAVDPTAYDFGTVEVGATARLAVTIANEGDADAEVTGLEYTTASGELTLDTAAVTLPLRLAPGESAQVYVDYAPTDDVADEGQLAVRSDDPDEARIVAQQLGDGKTFEGFSGGWYIVDSDDHYETTSDPAHVVDHHGDEDGYWYEPSGANGMIDSADPATDFATLRDYVIARAGAPTAVTGPLTFRSSSTVPTYTSASFSYILCDFWIDPSDDPALFEVVSGTVDDGISVIVNGTVLGYAKLGNGGAWNLGSVAVPGTVNTLVVILMDNAQVDKYVNELGFYRAGAIVTG